MSFAQLSYRESLRDIEVTLNSHRQKLYHMGLGGPVSRSTLADANEKRSFRIYRDFARTLIPVAVELYGDDPLPVDIANELYALDSSTVDLCLSLFPWATFRKTKAAIKIHTQLDLRGSIPTFIAISDGKTHDVNFLDHVPKPVDSIQVMDRGYLDFERLYRFNLVPAYFVIRAKSNLKFRRIRSMPVDKNTGVICDQIIMLTGPQTKINYPESLRRVRYYDPERKKKLVFLTNNFSINAKTVADIYRSRWQIELFFKWIKQHLRIKAFYGTSFNAVKTQIWIAITVYLLVAISKKLWKIEVNMHTFLQILEINLFEKRPINQIVEEALRHDNDGSSCNQLNLFGF